MKPIFYVYTKPGCHLCEILIEQLMETLRDKADIKKKTKSEETDKTVEKNL